MAKKGINIDLSGLSEGAASQFRGLNPREPGQWPILPKLLVWLGVTLFVVGLGGYAVLSDAYSGLQSARDKEPALKSDYRAKLAQAINLNELRKQRIQVKEYVDQLEKQLPGKAEMDALLSDINQAGLGRGLQFELFRPGNFLVKDYYVELPIALKVSGRYHDIGAFAADIANLSRIVTLHDMNITSGRGEGGTLSMEATARTYRYLDSSEIEAARDAAKKDKKK